MNATRLIRVWGLLVMVIVLVLAAASEAQAQWPQWGGPNRNFAVATTGLADEWPEGGPRKLWHRELGAGYSAIVCDDGVLYTGYRNQIADPDEYFVALDASTGKDIWKHKNHAPPVEPPDQRWGGQGPNSTPLVVGDRLFVVGSRSVLHCFDKKTGKVLWKHDLVSEFGAPIGRHVGYCCSPIAYKDMVIVPAGRPVAEEGAAPDSQREGAPILIAFEQATGKPAWKSPTFTVTYSSPILINFAGRDQLVFCTGEGLIGVDAAKGDLLWHHRVDVRHAGVSPVWNGRDLIFYSAAGTQASGRAVRLIESAGQIVTKEAWDNRKIRIGQPTPVQIDDHFYGATDRLLLAVDFATGKRVWAKRGFPLASCLHADGKLIILAENGWLTLATATPEGLTVHSKHQITERYSFSVPTLAGTTLFVRDRKHIMALDLG